MSEENSQTQNASQPSLYPQSSAIEPRSLEKDADALMDDLFSDIDILLEGSGQLPAQAAKAEYVTLQSVVVPSITLPTPEQENRENRQKSLEKKEKRRSRFSLKKNKAKSKQSSSEKTQSSFSIGQHADKIFFGVACLSLLGVGIWFFNRGRFALNPPVAEPALPTPQNESKAPIAPSQDAPFIGYMLRSLKVIASKPENSQIQETATLPTPIGDRPAATPTNSASSPQVIERVYIPVYPPNPNSTTPNNLSEAVVPPPPTPPTPPTVEEKQPEASPSPTPVDTNEANAVDTSEATPPEPPPERLGAYRPDELPTLDEENIEIETFEIPPTAEDYNIKLAGVLEAGSSSGALFRINDSTQRIAIGEIIGESGWILARIEGETAIIQRNGETRSIYVGQTF